MTGATLVVLALLAACERGTPDAGADAASDTPTDAVSDPCAECESVWGCHNAPCGESGLTCRVDSYCGENRSFCECDGEVWRCIEDLVCREFDGWRWGDADGDTAPDP